MKTIFLSLLMFVSLNVFALPTATVKVLKGKVQFNGKEIKQSDVIKENGLITTSPRSFVKIEVADWNSAIVIGPASSMKIDLSSPDVEKKYEFLGGVCRWKSLVTKSEGKKGKIFTKEVSVGVRGTDFLLTRNEYLGESEIIVFDGLVLFSNLADQNDSAEIKQGQWGGVGGRYGEKIGKIIDLPPTALRHYTRFLEL